MGKFKYRLDTNFAKIDRIQNPSKKVVKIMEAQLGTILKENDIVRYQDIYGRAN